MIFDCFVLTHEVNCIRISQVGDWSATDGDGGVAVSECLLHYLLKEKVKQDGGEQTALMNTH
ncbi:hypothetical protein DPMN_080115 [Dreissena polymorpha]|uniref:Uncharacterized protein n=1 Tax=Dreissena polymorpha TaxID=45954 RepID=A0A9D3YS12_DREPO|nr:hypothetical protein DPMN_080115 [Dreissena polymorpha]